MNKVELKLNYGALESLTIWHLHHNRRCIKIYESKKQLERQHERHFSRLWVKCRGKQVWLMEVIWLWFSTLFQRKHFFKSNQCLHFPNWSSFIRLCNTPAAWKVSKYGVFSGPYFPVFGLNTEIYSVNLRIQSEYRKIRTKKNSVFGHFLRSAQDSELNEWNTQIELKRCSVSLNNRKISFTITLK